MDGRVILNIVLVLLTRGNNSHRFAFDFSPAPRSGPSERRSWAQVSRMARSLSTLVVGGVTEGGEGITTTAMWTFPSFSNLLGAGVDTGLTTVGKIDTNNSGITMTITISSDHFRQEHHCSPRCDKDITPPPVSTTHDTSPTVQL